MLRQTMSLLRVLRSRALPAINRSLALRVPSAGGAIGPLRRLTIANASRVRPTTTTAVHLKACRCAGCASTSAFALASAVPACGAVVPVRWASSARKL